MREAVKILSLLRAHYPNEIEIFDDMSPVDRKSYANYALRKNASGAEFLSPSEWIDRQYIGFSFKAIGRMLGITAREAKEFFNSTIEKIQALHKAKSDNEVIAINTAWEKREISKVVLKASLRKRRNRVPKAHKEAKATLKKAINHN